MTQRQWSRREVLRASLLVGAAVSAPPLLGGCSALGFGNTLEEVRSEGRIRVGIAGEVPYSFLDGQDRLSGAIGSLHRAVFARIGDVTVEPVVVPFADLLDGLDAGTFDAVAAGMFITSGRCDSAIFSDPVYCAPSALLVQQGNPQGLSDYASVAEKAATLVVLGSAVEADYAREAGVSDGRIRTVGSQTAGLDLVASGEEDAFALTSISLRSLLERASGRDGGADLPGVEPSPSAVEQVELLDPFTPVVDGEPLLGCGGATFRSNDSELREAFNQELAALREQGDLLRILEPWGFTESEIPPSDVTTEQLCRAGGVGGTDYEPVPR